jgi:hypothetical protein
MGSGLVVNRSGESESLRIGPDREVDPLVALGAEESESHGGPDQVDEPARRGEVLCNPDKGFSDCGFELIAGLKVALGLDRVDLVGGDGRDDVNEGVDDGSMLGQIEG